MDITEEQWALIEPLFPEKETIREGVRGRPYRDPRDVFYGVLWVLRTGAPWHDLPGRYPPYQTCHRRFQGWVRDGTLKRILAALREDLRTRGRVDDIEAYIDGTYAGAKKGGPASDDAVPAMRRRSWRLQTALVFLSPFASEMAPNTTSASSTTSSTRPSKKKSRRS